MLFIPFIGTEPPLVPPAPTDKEIAAFVTLYFGVWINPPAPPPPPPWFLPPPPPPATVKTSTFPPFPEQVGVNVFV